MSIRVYNDVDSGTLIGTQRGDGTANWLDFQNIPPVYNHLSLRYAVLSNVAGVTANDLYLNINGRFGGTSDYTALQYWGVLNGAAYSGAMATSAYGGIINRVPSSGIALPGAGTAEFPGASNSGPTKFVLGQSSNFDGTTATTNVTAFNWEFGCHSATEPINRVTLLTPAGQFRTGSIASLYGH